MLEQLGLRDSEVRVLPARFVLGVLVPQLLFYLGLRSGGLVAALVMAGGWAVGLQLYDLVRRRALDPFLMYGLLFTIVQGAVALWTRSPAVYAGGGVVENLIGGALLLGSVALCRPLLVEVLSAVTGAQAVLTLPIRAALWHLTVLWAVLFFARSVGLYVALTHLTIGQFLVVNTVAGWPLNGVGALLSLFYVRIRIRNAAVMDGSTMKVLRGQEGTGRPARSSRTVRADAGSTTGRESRRAR